MGGKGTGKSGEGVKREIKDKKRIRCLVPKINRSRKKIGVHN